MKTSLRLTDGVCSLLPTTSGTHGTHLALILWTTITLFTGSAPSVAQEADPVSMSLAGSLLARINHPSTQFTTPAVRSQHSRWEARIASRLDPSGAEGRPVGILNLTRSIDSTSAVAIGIRSVEAGPWSELAGNVRVSHAFGRIETGMRLHLRSTRIEKYGATLVPSLDVGVAVPITSTVDLALLVTNATRSSSGRSPTEQLLSAGMTVRADSGLTLSLDVRSIPGVPISVRTGLSWRPLESVVARIGLGSEPERVGLGLGFLYDRFSLDLGTDFRFETGTSVALGGGVSW